MMAQNKQNGFIGFHILSQQSLSPDEVLLDVETQSATAPSRKQPLKFRRIGKDWKVVDDEDAVKGDYQKMKGMKSNRQ